MQARTPIATKPKPPCDPKATVRAKPPPSAEPEANKQLDAKKDIEKKFGELKLMKDQMTKVMASYSEVLYSIDSDPQWAWAQRDEK